MRKQITKALTMMSLVLLFTLVLTVANAQAQSRASYTAHIPFEFVVGNATLPAGDYTITQIKTADGTVMIQLSAKGQNSALRLTEAMQPREPRDKTVLVFNQYGQQYFLAEMWRAGEEEGRQVRKSRRERTIENELARNPSQNETARRDANSQAIVLAALAK